MIVKSFTWEVDEEGDIFMQGEGVDACICPHHQRRIKAVWDFARWFKWFASVDAAKEFLARWWSRYPWGVDMPAHKTRCSLQWVGDIDTEQK